LVLGKIADGSSAALLWPARKPAGLGTWLRRAELQGRTLRFVRGRVDDVPVDAIYRAAIGEVPSKGAKSARDLVQDERLHAFVVHVSEVEDAAVGPWVRFVEEFAGYARANAPGNRLVIIVELAGEQTRRPPKPDVALEVCRWDDWSSESDAYILAASMLLGRGLTPKRRALTVATVSRLAIWDLDLAGALCDVDAECLVRPNEFLAEWALGRGWTADSRANWEDGSAYRVDGATTPHSAYLAIADTETLDRRVWSAQAGMFLPWIEECRIQLLPKLRGHIRFPVMTDGGQVDRIEDLSIGQLDWALRGTSASIGARQTIGRLRRARNLLAHLQPLPAELALHDDLMR